MYTKVCENVFNVNSSNACYFMFSEDNRNL